jgi:hypothetical protein
MKMGTLTVPWTRRNKLPFAVPWISPFLNPWHFPRWFAQVGMESERVLLWMKKFSGRRNERVLIWRRRNRSIAVCLHKIWINRLIL